MSKITNVSISLNGLPHRKTPSLNVHEDEVGVYPVIYFTKPKYIANEVFEIILRDITNQINGLDTKSVAILEVKDD